MKYDVQTIREQFRQGARMSFIIFWGHRRKGPGIDASCFSQWYPSPFSEDGVTYATAEQYMMAHKAMLFGDDEMLAQIMASLDPSVCKKLGRLVGDFTPQVWDSHKRDIVVQASKLKFSQHQGMRTFLLNTRSAVLVEASPYDRIWGIGLVQEDARSRNPLSWRGENLLGFALMEARDALREGI